MPCGGPRQPRATPASPPCAAGRKPCCCPHSSHLGAQSPPLDLTHTLLDNEGHAIGGATGCLAEVLSKELQAALKLLVSTLDGQGLQTLLVAGQAALGAVHSSREPGSPPLSEALVTHPHRAVSGSTVQVATPSPLCSPDCPAIPGPAHLLALGAVEVDVAVALPALGW